MTEKQENETPKVEQPAGLKDHEVVTIKDDSKSEDTIYRKFDSEDMIKIRDHAVEIYVGEDGKERARTKSGAAQKVYIVLGIKRSPYFSDVIDERHGVTDVIFERRFNKEFRNIPVSEMDVMFRKIKEHNNADFDPKVMQKN